MQSHGITLSFHREKADSSEGLGIKRSAARFIKGGFQDYASHRKKSNFWNWTDSRRRLWASFL
jgi:hypothetical protein